MKLFEKWKERWKNKRVIKKLLKWESDRKKEMGEIVNYKLESLGLDKESSDDNIPCPIATDEHRFTGVSSINIIVPFEGQKIPIYDHSKNTEGVVRLQAEHENEKVLVNWYLNGNNIGTTVKMHNLIIKPDFGENTLLLVDENEESASIVFYAVEKELYSDNYDW